MEEQIYTMSTTQTPLDILREDISYAKKCALELAESRLDLAQRYAYDALVKEVVNTGPEARERELQALKLAFWYDGARHECEGYAYGMIQLQKRLVEYEESLKTTPRPNETDKSPSQ